MLCVVCDNITLKSLNLPLGYEHKPSFRALQESAEGGWCSLCSILWSAVNCNRAREASWREEHGYEEEEDGLQFLSYPVRLSVDGLIYENRERALNKIKSASYRKRNSKENDNFRSTYELYRLHTEKAPSAILVCSLQPDTFQPGLRLQEQGKAAIYREPRIDIFIGDPYAGRRISSQANSAACFQLIAHWMRVCLTEHKHCRRAVCPYVWTDMPEPWARSPSYVSSSSESESLDDGVSVNPFLAPSLGPLEGTTGNESEEPSSFSSSSGLESPNSPAGVTSSPGPNPSRPDDTPDGETGESKIEIASESGIESGRPPKRVRYSSSSQETTSDDGSVLSASHFGQDKAQVASNLKQLEEATVAQTNQTRSLTKRSPLSRGVLCRQVHRPRRDGNGSFDDGFYQLYPRSEDLRDLRDNPQRYHSGVEIPSEPTPLLPTRYIYVDSDPPQLRLGGADVRGFYIALSHCWGKSTPLVTTTESLADHMRGMPLKDMPKTFREAITITRELGLEFLWIDSLCILQDSKEDWEKESAKMSSVYGNAFLTLSASASEGCEQGIFQPRTVYPGPPVELRCNDSNFEPIYVDYMPENTVFQEPQTTDARAWCFQELALSPRVLVYGKEMLGWLCDSLTDVEHGFVKEHYENINPPLLAPRLNPEPAKNPLENSGSIFSLYHHSRERERSFSRWASMVNAFSRRKLTRESDKLPALSGIAREIHLETGDEYLAGLWRKDLSHHLLWNLDVMFAGKGAEWRRPLSYRAPSWSWAAIEGPIRMDLRPSELDKAHGEFDPPPDDVQVLEAKIEPKGHNPYGEIRSAHLKLSTRMWRVVLRPFQNKKYANPKLWLRPEKWSDRRFMERTREMFTPEGKRMGQATIDMPGERDLDVTELWVMKVDVWQSGLLITKDEAKDAYVRVGTAHTEPEKLNGRTPRFPETEIVEIVLL